MVAMAWLFLADAKMPKHFWFQAIQHAIQVMNYLPCKTKGMVITPFKLVHGKHLNFCVLFSLFLVGYYKVEQDSNSA